MMTSPPAADDGRRTGSGETWESAGFEPFVTEVERHDDVTIVRPRGDLDVATAPALQTTLNGIERTERLVLDLRGLSFIDSSGLQLLVELNQRAQHDGFRLALVAPAASVNKAIQLCALDETLPFAEAADAVRSEPTMPARERSARSIGR